VRSILLASGGFLLAVLWMDLMFDVQVQRLVGAAERREAAIASIAGYYRRVTTEAFPMNRLIAGVMLLQLWGITDQVLVHRTITGWRALLVVVLGTAPIGLALFRIVPAAVQLGGRTDALATQIALARDIFRGHVLCFAAIALFTLLQLRLPA
jgi:hypothetical protein